ncbi:MAG TPA: BlaI/MecI/CopY family transcriptional regulator [Streptosporangiaceae bacterium]|nr:BlaI/MecI/CopY family transcriptional regulator [Streptosporangiaceae bacterium]
MEVEGGVVADVGGALERAVMESLWAASGPLRVRELMIELNDGAGRSLAYNTVQTVAERLTRKGLLRRVRDGQAFRYCPTRSREEYTASLVLDALSDVADRSAVFARLAETMDQADARQLLQALRERAGEGERAGDEGEG